MSKESGVTGAALVWPAWTVNPNENPELVGHITTSLRDLEAAQGAELLSPHRTLLGGASVEYKGKDRKVTHIAAVDNIFTDGERVLAIRRKGDPDRDKLAFPGGLLDVPKDGGAINIKTNASRELLEEANAQATCSGVLLGDRKFVRTPPDIRVISDNPAHIAHLQQYDVKAGDLMVVSTEAVLWKVSKEEFDKASERFAAGDDAAKYEVKPMKELLANKSQMALDHGALLEEANQYLQAQKIQALVRGNIARKAINGLRTAISSTEAPSSGIRPAKKARTGERKI